MTRENLRRRVQTVVALVLVVAWSTVAHAQLLSNPSTNAGNNNASTSDPNGSGANVLTFPGTNIPGPTRNNLTPEQMKSIMMYRALQSRGSGQVRRGMPQFIPFGFGSTPQAFAPNQADGADAAGGQQSDRDAQKEAAREKRIAALKAAAEKQKAAREARAEARKAQQAQDQADGGK